MVLMTPLRSFSVMFFVIVAFTNLTNAELEAIYLSPTLEAVEINQGSGNTIDVKLIFQTPPGHFRIDFGNLPNATMQIVLPGYESHLSHTKQVLTPDHVVSINQLPDGVVVEIPIRGLAVREILRDGTSLTVRIETHADAANTTQNDIEEMDQNGFNDPYRVGPGDLLSISVFGHNDLGGDVRVVSNGTINFPLLGHVQVAGKTTNQIGNKLRDLLGEDFVVSPQIRVGVSKYLSQPIHLIGEIKRPGKYFLKGPTYIIDVLSEAGGLTENAGSEIILTRKLSGASGTSNQQFRVATETIFGSTEGDYNILLRAGDVLNVKTAPFFYIRGEVRLPGRYTLRNGTTIQKAISVAGGFTQWADEKDVQIIREANGKRTKYVINLKKVSKGKANDLVLEAEDVVVVTRRIL